MTCRPKFRCFLLVLRVMGEKLLKLSRKLRCDVSWKRNFDDVFVFCAQLPKTFSAKLPSSEDGFAQHQKVVGICSPVFSLDCPLTFYFTIAMTSAHFHFSLPFSSMSCAILFH